MGNAQALALESFYGYAKRHTRAKKSGKILARREGHRFSWRVESKISKDTPSTISGIDSAGEDLSEEASEDFEEEIDEEEEQPSCFSGCPIVFKEGEHEAPNATKRNKKSRFAERQQRNRELLAQQQKQQNDDGGEVDGDVPSVENFDIDCFCADFVNQQINEAVDSHERTQAAIKIQSKCRQGVA